MILCCRLQVLKNMLRSIYLLDIVFITSFTYTIVYSSRAIDGILYYIGLFLLQTYLFTWKRLPFYRSYHNTYIHTYLDASQVLFIFITENIVPLIYITDWEFESNVISDHPQQFVQFINIGCIGLSTIVVIPEIFYTPLSTHSSSLKEILQLYMICSFLVSISTLVPTFHWVTPDEKVRTSSLICQCVISLIPLALPSISIKHDPHHYYGYMSMIITLFLQCVQTFELFEIIEPDRCPSIHLWRMNVYHGYIIMVALSTLAYVYVMCHYQKHSNNNISCPPTPLSATTRINHQKAMIRYERGYLIGHNIDVIGSYVLCLDHILHSQERAIGWILLTYILLWQIGEYRLDRYILCVDTYYRYTTKDFISTQRKFLFSLGGNIIYQSILITMTPTNDRLTTSIVLLNASVQIGLWRS